MQFFKEVRLYIVLYIHTVYVFLWYIRKLYKKCIKSINLVTTRSLCVGRQCPTGKNGGWCLFKCLNNTFLRGFLHFFNNATTGDTLVIWLELNFQKYTWSEAMCQFSTFRKSQKSAKLLHLTTLLLVTVFLFYFEKLFFSFLHLH